MLLKSFFRTHGATDQVADAFAKHGLSQIGLLRIFEFPPNFIFFALLADNSRIVFPRDFYFCFAFCCLLVFLNPLLLPKRKMVLQPMVTLSNSVRIT